MLFWSLVMVIGGRVWKMANETLLVCRKYPDRQIAYFVVQTVLEFRLQEDTTHFPTPPPPPPPVSTPFLMTLIRFHFDAVRPGMESRFRFLYFIAHRNPW